MEGNWVLLNYPLISQGRAGKKQEVAGADSLAKPGSIMHSSETKQVQMGKLDPQLQPPAAQHGFHPLQQLNLVYAHTHAGIPTTTIASKKIWVGLFLLTVRSLLLTVGLCCLR